MRFRTSGVQVGRNLESTLQDEDIEELSLV